MRKLLSRFLDYLIPSDQHVKISPEGKKVLEMINEKNRDHISASLRKLGEEKGIVFTQVNSDLNNHR